MILQPAIWSDEPQHAVHSKQPHPQHHVPVCAAVNRCSSDRVSLLRHFPHQSQHVACPSLASTSPVLPCRSTAEAANTSCAKVLRCTAVCRPYAEQHVLRSAAPVAWELCATHHMARPCGLATCLYVQGELINESGTMTGGGGRPRSGRMCLGSAAPRRQGDDREAASELAAAEKALAADLKVGMRAPGSCQGVKPIPN